MNFGNKTQNIQQRDTAWESQRTLKKEPENLGKEPDYF